MWRTIASLVIALTIGMAGGVWLAGTKRSGPPALVEGQKNIRKDKQQAGLSHGSRHFGLGNVQTGAIPAGMTGESFAGAHPGGEDTGSAVTEAHDREENDSSPWTNENLRPQTAKEWFSRGMALNDDSDREMRCYLEALKLDPEFAPAHFRLGALYMRRADFERGEQQLAFFWAQATRSERAEYDIHLFTDEQTLQARLVKMRGTGRDDQGVGRSIPYHTVNQQIVVRVLLDGHIKADMLLDTGASMTVLAGHLAREGKMADQGEVLLRTIAEQEVSAKVVQLDSLQAGPVTKRGFRVAVADIPALNENGIDGILGMDVLDNRSLHIDRKRKRVVVE